MSDETILVVDDEVANLQKLRRTFINRYPVLAAGSGREALELIKKHDNIAVIVADQRMPDMTGIELLRETLDPLPFAVRIILTGYTDTDVLMEAINSCKVFRYMVKPWDPPDLLMTVERGLESYRLTIENAQIRKELIRRERLARDLEIARDIQRYILPSDYPKLDGYDMAVEYHPAREVGGDLYDFSHDPETGTFQAVVGDVSGKSIPAALYGAVFSGQLRTLFTQSMSPVRMLGFLNETLISRPSSNYIAVVALKVDLASGAGLLANAGMPYPYVLRAGEVTRLCVPGVPLGLMEDASFDEVPFRIEPGDTLLLTSDGTTDAVDPDGRIYDPHRFIDSLRKCGSADVAGLLTGLLRGIVDFAGTAELADDVTMLALRRQDR